MAEKVVNIKTRSTVGGTLLTEKGIRDLCVRLIEIEDPEEFRSAVVELRIALREHIKGAENRAIQMILNKPKVKAEIAGDED